MPSAFISGTHSRASGKGYWFSSGLGSKKLGLGVVIAVALLTFFVTVSLLAWNVETAYPENHQTRYQSLVRRRYTNDTVNDTYALIEEPFKEQQLIEEEQQLIEEEQPSSPYTWSIWGSAASGSVIVRAGEDSTSPISCTLAVGSLLVAREYESQSATSEDRRIHVAFPCSGWVNVITNGEKVVEKISLGRPQANECDSIAYLQNTDMKGGDLSSAPASTASSPDCCTLCSQNPLCAKFTHTADGACWLKSPLSTEMPGPKTGATDTAKKVPVSMVSGVLRSRLTNGSMAMMATKSEKSSKSSRQLRMSPVVAPCCRVNVDEESHASIAKGDSSTTTLSQFSNGRRGDLTSLGSSPFALRLERKPQDVDWTTQWPVGTGRFGALVGGTVSREVIPLSIADLYVVKTDDALKQQKRDEGAEKKYQEAFQRARGLLREGRVGLAEKEIAKLQQPGLGMFEGLADLVLVYSAHPLQPSAPTPAPTPAPVPQTNNKDSKKKHRSMRSFSSRGTRLAGRAGALDVLRKAFEPSSAVKPQESTSARSVSSASPEGFRDMLYSEGLLDLEHGIASGVFLEAPLEEKAYGPTDADAGTAGIQSGGDTGTGTGTGTGMGESLINAEGARLHYREWFASAVDDVLVGTMSCVEVGSSGGGCVNVAMQLKRENSPRKTVVKHTIKEVKDDTKENHRKEDSKTFAVMISVEESEEFMAPSAVACGFITCMKGVAFIQKLADGSEAIVCNGAESVEVLLSMDLNQQPMTPYNTHTTSKSTQKAEETCWDNVLRASDKGVAALRRDSATVMSERMRRTQVDLANAGDERRTFTCASAPTKGRVQAFSEGCASNNGTVENNSLDADLLAKQFQFGRYLLFSSATKAVPNLQGIWADGPAAAWNGDYHMNINIQQAYWAVHSTGITEARKPLIDFLKKLSHSGHQTAQAIYGIGKDGDASSDVSGVLPWVAHGFTDSRFPAGILADAQWALCVTCGAWLALEAFEMINFDLEDFGALSSNSVSVENDVIPLLAGVAAFFTQYMWEDEHGIAHTGPTTSPENSYEIIFHTNTTARALGFLVPEPTPHIKLPPKKQVKAPPAHNANPDGSEEAEAPSNPAADLNPTKTTSRRRLQGLLSIFNSKSAIESKDSQIMEAIGENMHVGKSRNLNDEKALKQKALKEMSSEEAKGKAGAGRKLMTPRRIVNVLVHSPAIDASILRQAANALTLSVQWLKAAKSEAQKDTISTGLTELDALESLSNKFAAMVGHMPGAALPLLDANECMLEYPDPLPSSGIHSTASSSVHGVASVSSDGNVGVGNQSSFVGYVSEELDRGHRHWSPLHWVYPGSLHPGSADVDADADADADAVTGSGGANWADAAMEGARNLLHRKMKASSGHTSWSAAWEAALRARLREPEEGLAALQRILKKFSAANLMSLHPQLSPLDMLKPCGTCFAEAPVSLFRESGTNAAASKGRGLTTQDDDKFQIDANFAVVGALSEMLVQSHLPGHLLLLPALPAALKSSGRVIGMRTRGGGSVSFLWSDGRITAAKVHFQKPRREDMTFDNAASRNADVPVHPWLEGIVEIQAGSGFFTAGSGQTGGTGVLFEWSLMTPNEMRIVPVDELDAAKQPAAGDEGGDRGDSKAGDAMAASNACLQYSTATDSAGNAHTGRYRPSAHWLRGMERTRLSVSANASRQAKGQGQGQCTPSPAMFCDATLEKAECRRLLRGLEAY